MSILDPFIAISDNAPRVQFTASGSQTEFDFDFPIFSSGDLVVVETNSGDTDTVRTLGSGDDQYVLDGVGDADGGSVTFNTARTNGNRITIYLDKALERTTVLALGGGYSPERLNLELSGLLLQIKQVNDQFRRVPLAEVADLDATLTLPRKADRANKLLGFDSSGNLTAVDP